MSRDDRRQRLEQALGLIEGDDDRSLVYAALELRQLVELIVYKKLESYAKWIPASVTQSWKPAHAFKMLLEFEPEADKDFTLYISTGSPGPEGPWGLLGEHKSFSAKWLSKTYNKLGSFIHIPHGHQHEQDPTQLRFNLRQVADEIKAIIEAPIAAGTPGQRVSINCMICEQPSISSVLLLRDRKKLTCFNPECGAVHLAEEIDGSWRFSLDTVTATCVACGEDFQFVQRLVSPGTTVDCPCCKAEHVFSLGLRLSD